MGLRCGTLSQPVVSATKIWAVAGALPLFSMAAQADVTISASTTMNMVCTSGVCSPTAKKAVLNVTALENLLASGDVTVTTAGSSHVQAHNIDIAAPISWSDSSTLTLDAYQSIAADRPVDVAGPGSLAILTDDGGKGGTFSFGNKGHITFENLAGGLSINHATFTLVGDIHTLASYIAASPGGDFALANSYDAKADGTYNAAPIATTFSGIFEGLGNTISDLSINDPVKSHNVGLFAIVGSGGTINDIHLTHASVKGYKATVGAVAGVSGDTPDGAALNAVSVTGFVSDVRRGAVGGVVGLSYGTIISNSVSEAKVEGGDQTGGLVGENAGVIQFSFATGPVSSHSTFGVDGAFVGGLAGVNTGYTMNSYATGAVSTGKKGAAGGLVGYNLSDPGGGYIEYSYSTGAVTGGPATSLGGLVGYDVDAGHITDAYWDTDTSGITNPAQGTGNVANDPGITGLTTIQLQSGLPQGFDPAVWHESAAINGGLPYLLVNPPPK